MHCANIPNQVGGRAHTTNSTQFLTSSQISVDSLTETHSLKSNEMKE